MKCRHGVEFKSIHVWNDNCGSCRSDAEIYQADMNRIHHGSSAMREDREKVAVEGRRKAAQAAAAEIAEEWTRRRNLGIAARARWVERRLKSDPELPPHIAAVMEDFGDVFTPNQITAVTYTYGYGLSQREAAEVLGIKRARYRKWIQGADVKLHTFETEQRRNGGDGFVWKVDGSRYVDPNENANRVVSMRGRKGVVPRGAVYVGGPVHWVKLSGTKWANPYAGPMYKGKLTRDEAIAMYREHVLASPELMAALPELRGQDLACWCSPMPCHADVLLELIHAADGDPAQGPTTTVVGEGEN